MVTKPSPIKHLYEFGPFRLDPQRRLLLRGNDAVPLTPKAVETLVVLVENRDHVVSKDDLMAMLWPNSFVEESNLTQNVFVLRKALGDSAQERRYILNVPGRGYQFTETVRDLAESPPVDETLVLESHSRSQILVAPSAPRAARLPIRSLLAILAAGAIASGVLLYRDRHRQPAQQAVLASRLPAVKMRRSVAVLGFRNLSGRPDKAWLSTALSEMLNTELAAGEQLRTVPGEEVARVSRNSLSGETDTLAKDTLARLRANLGTDYVALGSYTVVGQGSNSLIRLDFRLQDAAAGETLVEDAVTGNESGLFDLISEVGSRMRERLAVAKVSNQQAGEVLSALPANPTATRYYAEGLTKLHSYDALAARDLLEKAISTDPSHALSYSALGEAWSVLGYDAKAEQEAKKAFQLSTDLPREQRLSIEGRYRELSNDLPAAIEIYRTLRNFFPDDLDYALRLATAQVNAGLGNDALQTVALMRRLPESISRDARIDIAEASAADAISDFKRCQLAAVTGATKAEANGSPLLAAAAKVREAWASIHLGEMDRAFASYARASALWTQGGNYRAAAAALHGVATVQRDKGDFANARKSFEDAIRQFREIGAFRDLGSCLHNFGVLLTYQGNLPEAMKQLQEALRIQTETRNERGVASDLDDIGNVLLYTGDLSGATRVKEQALQAFRHLGNKYGESVTLLNMGEVFLAQGQVLLAKEKFEQSLALTHQISDKRDFGYGMLDMALVLTVQDRLADARAAAEQSIDVRRELKDEATMAESNVQMAEIELQLGNASKAESFARAAASAFDKQNAVAHSSEAYAALARTLLRQEKISEAETAADRALALSHQSGDIAARFEATLVMQRVQAELGKFEQAAKVLEDVRREANRHGFEGVELEARLHLGELELRSGKATAGRARLQQLQSDARSKNFLLIARQAADTLQAASPHP